MRSALRWLVVLLVLVGCRRAPAPATTAEKNVPDTSVTAETTVAETSIDTADPPDTRDLSGLAFVIDQDDAERFILKNSITAKGFWLWHKQGPGEHRTVKTLTEPPPGCWASDPDCVWTIQVITAACAGAADSKRLQQRAKHASS